MGSLCLLIFREAMLMVTVAQRTDDVDKEGFITATVPTLVGDSSLIEQLDLLKFLLLL